jgi:hypothetical protein
MLVATNIMIELSEFDRLRFAFEVLEQEGFDENSIHGFVDDGAWLYQQHLAVLHQAAFASPHKETRQWLKFARKSRKKLAKQMPGLIRGNKHITPTDEDVALTNTQHPESSYTGSDRAPAVDELAEQLRAAALD